MAKYNVSKSEAKKLGIKRVKISGGSSSKDEKKAKEKSDKYYKELEKQKKEEAARKTARLKEDLENILQDAGIAKTRTIEDYLRNIGNIEENKAADVDDLNYYIETSKTRADEDLDVSLAKETRRFQLETERISQDLADRGLTFSERKDEKVAKEGSEFNKEDIKRVAERSFQDIKRFEFAKNRDIELKYGQQTEEATVSKTRTLDDIVLETNRAKTQNARGVEDVKFGLDYDLRDISYEKDTSKALIEQQFDNYESAQRLADERRSVLGY